MEVRQAYACESFEWDQLRRLVERDGQAANVSLLRGRVRPQADAVHAKVSALMPCWRALWAARGRAPVTCSFWAVAPSASHPCMEAAASQQHAWPEMA